MRPTSLPCALCLLTSTVPAHESLAVFDAPVIVVDEFSRMDDLLDLDNDGDDDALGWWWVTNFWNEMELRLYENDGQGAFQVVWSFVFPSPGSGYTYATACGDLDGDLREDFAIGFNDTIGLYHSNGATAPTLASTITLPGSQYLDKLQLADCDGNGTLDLIVMRGFGVDVYSNPGDGSPLSLLHSTALFLGQGGSMQLLDTGGDSLPDLLITKGSWVHLLENTGSGFSQLSLHRFATQSSDLMPCAGDIDGDGDMDVVVFDADSNYEVLRCVGPSTYALESVAVGGPATELADIDGDGDLDGICCGGGGEGPFENSFESTFHISINDGTGQFAEAMQVKGLGARHLAGASDLDQDGDLDLVAGRAVLFGGPGLTASLRPVIPFTAYDVANLSDPDGDGDPDLMAGLDRVIRNEGDGAFSSHTPTMPAPPASTQWFSQPFGWLNPGIPGDFDGDGDTDRLLSNWSGSIFLQMRILRNRGGGAYEDAGPAAAPGDDFNLTTNPYWRDLPQDFLTTDVDGDGDVDLISVLADSQVWCNDGTGYFTAGSFLSGAVVQHVVRIDADAFPDLVVRSGTQVQIYQGDGVGSFTLASSLPVATAGRVAVADFDEDGDADIVAIRDLVGRAELFTNDGTGAFLSAGLLSQRLHEGTGVPRRADAVDLDRDGHMDLILAPAEHAYNSSWILLRNAAADGWKSVSRQVLQVRALGDIDGDDDIDVVQESVIRNRLHEGEGAGERRQYGAPAVGAGGLAPVLGASGPFRLGESAALHLTNGAGGAFGLLVLGFTGETLMDFPRIGIDSYVGPFAFWRILQVSGSTGASGQGSWHVPFTVPAEVNGLTIYHQVFLLDPAAPTAHLAASNALELRYGMLP